MTQTIIRKLNQLLNIGLMSAVFAYCWYHYYWSGLVIQFMGRGNWVMVALYAGLYIVFANVYEAFLVEFSHISELIYSQGLAAIMSTGVAYVVTSLISLNCLRMNSLRKTRSLST